MTQRYRVIGSRNAKQIKVLMRVSDTENALEKGFNLCQERGMTFDHLVHLVAKRETRQIYVPDHLRLPNRHNP